MAKQRTYKPILPNGERYINPLTDFGFKRIFGSQFNSELLISFLNALFDGEKVITEVSYNNVEHFGRNPEERKAVFDVYCTTDTGARIIVEMQNVYQEFYKDRSIYYSTFPISEQAQRGSWNYELDDVYTIGILNFAFPEDKMQDNRVTKIVKLTDIETKRVFYEKLTYIYVELDNFNKPLSECRTIYDKWLFCLRNMSALLDRPAELQGRVFERLFQTAEIAKFNSRERRAYELSSNAYRDIKNGMDSAKKEGLQEGIRRGIQQGIQQGILEERKRNAKAMKDDGMPMELIAKYTGLASEEIELL